MLSWLPALQLDSVTSRAHLSLTQQEGSCGHRDPVRQQMFQEEREEVAVEVAVKYL